MRLISIIFLIFTLAACSPQTAWGPPVRDVDIEALRQAAPEGQLSGLAKPVAYRATLEIDPRQPVFSGVVEIDVQLERPATGLWMHGEDLDVQSVQVRSGQETLAASWTEVLSPGVVWVGFPRRTRGEEVSLTIEYTAAFDANLAGMFRVEEQGRAYALAKSESIQARKFIPGFDEPGFKAPFDMTFIVPDGMQAIANTPEISRTRERAGYERVRFKPTRPLSTYLLSAAVGDFDKVVRADIPPGKYRDAPLPLTGYARVGKGDDLDYILSITPAFVQIFEDALQQPYPYEKLDIIAAPQWPSGATELAGAITYRESRILMGENAGPAFRRALKEIHAHEIAHMWFGDLVTPTWWNDLWLKEGFAEWGEPMVLTAFEPQEGHEVQAVSNAISAMRLDSLESVRAVSQPIYKNDNIRNAYDAIAYRKGMAIISMADSYFGPDSFRPALGKYIAQFADRDADSEDFFKVIGDVTGEDDLTEAFESFVMQKGVPVLETELLCETPVARLKVRQSRYRPVGSSIDKNVRWTVPMCVSAGYGDETVKVCEMLRSTTEVLSLSQPGCPDWVMPNAGGAGYYRFNLPTTLWGTLVEALPGLPATEALSVIDSGMATFRAGKMPADLYLSVLDAGAMHDDPRVIGAVLNAHAEIIQRLPEGDVQAAAKEDIQSMMNRIRSRISEIGSMEELLSRMDVFEAVTLENAERQTELLSRLDEYLGDARTPADPSALSSDLYLAALTVSIQTRGEAAFDRALMARREIDDPVFEQAVIRALGAATAPALVARVQALILSGELGTRETFTLAQTQMADPETRDETWQFLKTNFPAFLDNIPGQWRRLTPRLAGRFCDADRLPELDTLFDTYGGQAAGHERALSETRESITLCAALRSETEADLITAFQQ